MSDFPPTVLQGCSGQAYHLAPPACFATRFLASLLILSLSACSNLGYYFQAVGGQAEISRESQPIAELLADPATPIELKQKLAAVVEIRGFASKLLGLPNNGSFKSYADLKRPFVVWNVFATPELSVQPKEWCFLFAGCVSYRGYFSLEEAEKFAQGLDSQRTDVFIGGVPAYSTLGWFSDPVLNTFVHFPETEIARLIFHELAHQVVYVPGDSVFNESFATTVEMEGMRRWLEAKGSLAQTEQFATAQQRRIQFIALMMKYRERLEEHFKKPVSDSEKHELKALTFAEMAREYAELKASWNGFAGYDRWFSGKLNNAHLASIAIYTDLLPAFQALLADANGDLEKFYTRVKEIAALPQGERRALLDPYAASGAHSIMSQVFDDFLQS
ncbi:MAG: aminopeptidase [Burkholderiales bacterium]